MLKKIILLFTLSISLLFSFDDLKLDISNTLSKVDKTISLYKDKKENKNERNNEVFNTIEPLFHFELMAQLSIGKEWRNFTNEERNSFINAYKNKMKESLSEKLELFDINLIEIGNVQKVKEDRIIVKSKIKTEKEEIELDFKMYKPKKDILNKKEWLVYDVIISGVSFISADRAQYSGYLKTHSPNELIELMNSSKD